MVEEPGMRELIDKAHVLHEALPYIQRFQGATFVVKYGGHAMVDDKLKSSFARDVALLKFVGIHPVVVHGGGPQIDQMLAKMGVVSERVDGMRITDERTMEVVEMVLAGTVNQEIVSMVCGHGGRAVGLSGKDDLFIRAVKAPPMKTKSGTTVDPGRVGEIERVNPDIVKRLVEGGFIPVIAPIAVDSAGASLNVNADLVASHVAASLRAEKFVVLTDIEGVRGKGGALLSHLDQAEVTRLIDDGTIAGGMIPKVRCAFAALDGGVKKVHIVDGRIEHAILLEIFTDRGIGTEIVAG
jgi:acetylglutamate kinase